MIFVARAIVIRNGKILAAQRPESMSLPLLWELPGGKVEPEELAEDCVVRETWEEMGIHVEVAGRLGHLDREFKGKQYRMVAYSCRLVSGVPRAIEHAQVVWQPLDRLFELAWAPAEELLLRKEFELMIGG